MGSARRETADKLTAKGHPNLISVSIVSHGHASLVATLLDELRQYRPGGIEVILTLNIEEALPFEPDSFPFPVEIIRNVSPKGFAANHNAAFASVRDKYFCVLNPDIRLASDPFPALLDELKDASVGAVAPLIVGPDGAVEDSARPFPTLASTLRKALGFAPKRYYKIGGTSLSPDWVAGMFVLMRKDVFAEVGGFDAGYHLYYEDVDLCARLRLRGYDIRLAPKARAVHVARRESRRNPRFLYWHLRSMLRYFLSRTQHRAEKPAAR